MTAVSNAVNAVIFPGSKESGIGDRRLKMLHIITPHVECLFASYGQLIIWLDCVWELIVAVLFIVTVNFFGTSPDVLPIVN